ncbi:tetratricopeptide repeat protein [Algoriphagus sp. CAU 1675]|uniref:tetratricopeptide repeat protein n=1 Tax=Algoriphagus sp. CAU 1675 TaxID=3032597 RepID=UPI0023DC33C8|nr:tetratricopeptide repeat protein [Algoriphagus sp. CAU 1675]MDF2156695.1 tetratricopeptide repeat protein [Algoriphagus sp. CAU 1675]
MNFISQGESNTSIYRPFTLLTFALEYAVFGEFEASHGHAINVILYFIALGVVGLFLQELAKLKSIPTWVPLMALAIYALHPIHTEVVASVKSRDTLLATTFAFSAILIWLRSREKISVPVWTLILALFFLSLISKEESLPLLALVGLVSWFFLKRNVWESVQSVLPFLIPTALYLGLRALFLDSVDESYSSQINSVLFAAEGGERLATNLYFYLLYLKLLVFPHPLSWDYSFSQLTIQSFSNPFVWLSLGVFVFLGYVAFKGFKSRNLISFGILFYLTSFSIFANLTTSLTIGANIGERFLFIPSLAFSFLVAWGMYQFANLKWKKNPALYAFLIICPVLVAFTWKTLDRSKVWEDNMSLTASGIKTAPNSWRAHMMHAEELRLKGKELEKTSPDSARPYFEKSVVHYDRSFEILGPNPPVSQYYNTLAESLIGIGDSVRAKKVLKLSTQKAPRFHYAWFKLAILEFVEGNYGEAKNLYLQSLKAENPEYFATYKNLAQCYLKLNQNREAIANFEKALEYQKDEEINKILAYLYTEEGMTERAEALVGGDSTFNVQETAFLLRLQSGNEAFERRDYSEAAAKYQEVESQIHDFGGLEKYPFFYEAFGKSLLETGDTLGAKAKFLKAFQANPNNAMVLTNLGVIAYFKEKKYTDAERYFRQAITNNPEDPFTARMNLGTVLLIQRKEKDAVQVLEDALNYGSSKALLSNLYLVHKSLGNTEKMNHYLQLLRQ